jgi:hypothetical protein
MNWNLDFIYRARLHLRRAEYYERLDQPARAAEHYAKFIDIWKDCDEELRPQVEEARARLAALTPGEG